MGTGLLAATLLASCATPALKPYARQTPDLRPLRTLRPVVAVTEFENRAGFSGQWHLGDGMADVLSSKLLDSGRVVVLDRRNLQDILSEIALQGRDLFRLEGRVDRGRLINARYLLRGVITDFTVTGDGSGWFGMPTVQSRFGIQRSRVAVNIKISDVQTGEILASVQADGTASAGWFGGATQYKQVMFGGDAFYQTPLGRATEQATSRAVRRILEILPVEYWEPRVAEVDGPVVILNGGVNVDLRVGMEFLVREKPSDITDPIRGDVIEQLPGAILGRIRVVQIRPASARGELVEGRALRGAYLEPVH
jgi:curli biogenesis system outer membrane secretion channel CsgG